MPRYFLMRCAEARVVDRAHTTRLWPVAAGLVDRLNDAFASGEGVVLIFTVSLSGSYQGAARMVSTAGQAANTGWAACRLEWIKRADVPYSEAEHLINPLSDPPQPVRAGKNGTEIAPGVAEELLGMLQKAASISPTPLSSVGPSTGEQKGAPLVGSSGGGGGGGGGMGGGSAGVAIGMGGGGMGGMVGAGMMGMPDPYLMGMQGMQGMQGMHAMHAMNPMLAMQMMNPAMMMQAAAAGMMNPMAAAMMMGGMPGMMAAGMRPTGGMPSAALTLPGTAGTGKEGGLSREAAGTDRAGGSGPGLGPGPKSEMGPPPGFGGPGGGREGRGYGGAGGREHEERQHPDWDREREWERERERGRYDPRFDGAPPRGGGPPFRDGPPPYWDGPPPHNFRDGPPQFRDGPPPFGRLHDRAPPGRPGYGPPPPHLSRDYQGPAPREYGGPAPGGAAVPRPQRERERPQRERDVRPDVLRMTYEEYVERFQQLKEVQNGGTGTGTGTGKLIDGGAGSSGGGAGAEGKENAAAAAAGAAGDGEEAAGDGSQEAGDGDGAGGGPAGAANVQLMGEEEYVAYCERFSAQMGMPFNAEMVREHYKTMKEAVVAQQGQQSGGVGGAVAAS